MLNTGMKRRLAVLAGLAVTCATSLTLAFAGPAIAADNDNGSADSSSSSDSADSADSDKAATQATTCTENVRVRSQPSMTAPVIGTCSAGEKVTADAARDGFAHLASKNGWVSLDYLGLSKATEGDDKSDDDSSDDDNKSDDDSDSDDDNNDNNYGSRGGGILGL